MCDRDQGPFLAAPADKPAKAGSRVTLLGVRRGPRRLGERPAQPAIPFAGRSLMLSAGRFMVPGTDPGPRREVRRRGKRRDRPADFGQHDFRGAAVHAGDLIQPTDRRLERDGARGDLAIHLRDLPFEKRQLSEQQAQLKAMMGRHMAGQRRLQRRLLVAQAPARKRRDLARVDRPRRQALEHRARRDPQEVRRHAAQFHVRILQRLLNPGAMTRTRGIADQLGSLPGQVPQLR